MINSVGNKEKHLPDVFMIVRAVVNFDLVTEEMIDFWRISITLLFQASSV
jgi:hypothetical protein